MESLILGFCFDCPPDGVVARATRGQRRLVTKGAFVSSERGEHHTALPLVVTVVEDKARHACSLPLDRAADIGAAP